jgi:hypothetical protein
LDNEKEKGQYVRYMKEEDKYVPAAPSKADLFILQQETANNSGWLSAKGQVLEAMGKENHWKKYRNN